MSKTLQLRRRRAAFRAGHRGTREMDLLLGRFAAARLDHMDERELAALERLLEMPDPDLQRRLMAPIEESRDDYQNTSSDHDTLINQIRAFHGLADRATQAADRQD